MHIYLVLDLLDRGPENRMISFQHTHKRSIGVCKIYYILLYIIYNPCKLA